MLAARALLVAATAVLVAAAPGFAAAPESSLDARGWELVSPVEKGGGQVGRPSDGGAGAFAAAAAGGAIAFGADDSFADGAGAPPVSQYLATRAAGSGWSTANVSPPLLAGTYAGGAYQLYSADLTRSLLSNGWRCRDGAVTCPAQNASLAAAAPAGYRTLYLRDGAGYRSLITDANAPALAVAAPDFALSLEGATPDLGQVVIASCAALLANVTEVPGGTGCDPAQTNLYRWSEGELSAVNFLPGETSTAPGATLAAPSGAISSDGSRVYWSRGGDLYLREGSVTQLVASGAEFQAATTDGMVAFYLQGGHLLMYSPATGSEDLTPSGGVQGVLAASPVNAPAASPYVYYLTGSGLFLWHGGSSAKIAAGADLSNLPPATGTARITPDGTRLAFVSSASLTGFANAGKAEVYLYEAPGDRLTCVSCNPFGTAPLGPSTIPSARRAAEGPYAYQPRNLSTAGGRLFFDSSDRLVSADSDGEPDVYQWEAQGTGSCTAAAGCVGLVSNGRTGADSFLDASADGTDAFFLTPASLVGADTGGLDVYDARAGGGFPESPPVVPCEGDACQGAAPSPTDLIPATATLEGPVNQVPRFVEQAVKKPSKHKKKKKRKRAKKAKGAGGKRASSRRGGRS